ncbi:MAG TPA: class I SAM-dependent methyltransferase [Caulobacteraceae bacterium]|nr:class I SAM-dependent methyltransferase [Caulobacteraceae bacterium]
MKASADAVAVGEAQAGNRAWWTANTMSYDWKDRISREPLSREWFDEVDRRFIESARHFAHSDRPFGRIIPFDAIAGKRVLEVGCGMGLHTELMARAGAHVTAIDISPKSVAATKARLALRGVQADVREADAEAIDFDEAFEFIWSWGVIHHSARTGRVLRNLHAALTPGGQLRFMVYSLEGMQSYAVIVSRYLLGFWRGQSLDEILWRSTDGYLARYFTRDSLADLCRTFFDDVEVEVFGLEADAVPLPAPLRRLVRPLVSDRYIERAVRKRGAFLFATATKEGA